MFTSVAFLPGSSFGVFRLQDAVIVHFEGYDSWRFESDHCQRSQYENALRFIRLVERGYAPKRAYEICRAVGSSPTLATFEKAFEPSAHDKLSDERVTALPLDCPDMMFVDPLTPADEERLYALWLMDGDEVFHFDPELSALWDIPGLLSRFRALAQSEDEITGGWSHSHHLDFVAY
jgi:hypothetical protein